MKQGIALGSSPVSLVAIGEPDADADADAALDAPRAPGVTEFGAPVVRNAPSEDEGRDLRFPK